MSMNIINGRNNGFPCLYELDDLPSSTALTVPYPEFIMRMNNSLPEFNTPHHGTRLSFTDLAVNIKNTDHLYFNGHRISAAYMNDNEHMRIYTIK